MKEDTAIVLGWIVKIGLNVALVAVLVVLLWPDLVQWWNQ